MPSSSCKNREQGHKALLRPGRRPPELRGTQARPRPFRVSTPPFGHSGFAPWWIRLICCLFFNDTATTEIYTLSLHDALPIFHGGRHVSRILRNRRLRPRGTG